MLTRNLYAPPRASISDQPGEVEKRVRPRRIALAVRLLWLEFGLAVIQAVVQATTARDHLSSVAALLTALVTLLPESWVIYKISAGRNWARVVAVAAIAISMVMWFHSAPLIYRDEPLSVVLGMIELMLDVAALWLLFSNPSRIWFRRTATP